MNSKPCKIGAMEILHERDNLAFVMQALADRATSHDQEMSDDAKEALRQRVRERTKDLLDAWAQIARDYDSKGTNLQYQPKETGAATHRSAQTYGVIIVVQRMACGEGCWETSSSPCWEYTCGAVDDFRARRG